MRTAVPVVILLLLAGVGTWLFLKGGGGALGERTWFYDLSERELYIVKSSTRAPHEGIGGEEGDPDGVLAVVYTCTDDCDDRQIAYLQTCTPELAALWKEADEAEADGRPVPAQLQDRMFLTEHTLVRSPDGDEWFPKSSDEGRRIVAVMTSKCENGNFPKACDPAD